MPDSMESSYNAWLGRKQTTLRRPTLDCGCVNGGEVSFHIWCDRLACQEHADAPHDCGEFKGSKSGIEEEAVEPEVVVEAPGPPPAPVADPRQSTADFVRDVAAFGRYYGLHGSAPICRGCRSVPSEPSSFGQLCAACFDTEACSTERTNALDNRHMICIRPSGHQPPCEEQAGSQWYAESPAAPLRPFLSAALDSEAAAFTAGVFAALDELVEPDPDAPVVEIRPDPMTHAHEPGSGHDPDPNCRECAAKTGALWPPARPWWRRMLGGAR